MKKLKKGQLQTAACNYGENGGECNPPYMHEVQRVWNEERGEWVIELTGSSMCTDCLQYDCFEWEDQALDPRRCECGPGAEFVGLKEFDSEKAQSWAEIAAMTPLCASCGLEEPAPGKNAPTILDDIKAQGFPNGPDWERYDYTTGGDGLESPTEYWTNKKTGISYKVEAEAVIEHYAAEVYHSPDPYISTPPEVCKSKIKKEKRTF